MNWLPHDLKPIAGSLGETRANLGHLLGVVHTSVQAYRDVVPILEQLGEARMQPVSPQNGTHWSLRVECSWKGERGTSLEEP